MTRSIEDIDRDWRDASPDMCGHYAIEMIQAQREVINDAYRILCAGDPPWSARETNARRVLTRGLL